MAPGGPKDRRPTVKGVRVACIGEVMSGVAPLANCELPLDHDVFSLGELCPISELVRMPFLVSRVRPSLRYAATKDSFGYELDDSYHPNTIIKALMICCDARLVRESNGEVALLETPKRWSKEVGSVVLARKDHQPICAHHVQVLLQFIRTVNTSDSKALFNQSFQKCGNHGNSVSPRMWGDDASAEDIVAHLTPGDFKEFYQLEKYHWKQEIDSVHLLDLPSPWSEGETMVSKRDKMATARLHCSKQKLDRRKYRRMTFDEKLEDIQTWREYYLLTEIARLKARLGEGPDTLIICCRKVREKAADIEEVKHPMYASYRP